MKPYPEEIVALRSLLYSLPDGPVTGGIDVTLSAAWDYLRCSGRDGALTAVKIYGRLEKVVWNPPILSFQVERHGGTVNGSSRAEMQHWEVDIEKETRDFAFSGHRQLYPMARRWDCRPVAKELASCIRSGLDHEGLRWRRDGKVTINRTIIPDCAKQTMEPRAKRLNEAIGAELGDSAWRDKPWRTV